MADRDAPGLNDHEKDNDPAAMLQGESDRIGTTRAEPLTRQEYADAVRGSGLDDSDQRRSPTPYRADP